MFSITKVWTEEKIRFIIHKLDEKTGLSGADLPIAFKAYGNTLGNYQYVEPKAFGFNRKFFNASSTNEAEVIDVIRHEYAHYYCDVAHLAHYIGHSVRETSHGDDWKWACKMVGADPTRCHNASIFSNKNWSEKEAAAVYNAEDVKAFNILSYLKTWDQVPMDSDSAARVLTRIKESTPNSYFEDGDEIVHPKRGFGIVIETIPCKYRTQKVQVLFEDLTDGVFRANELCKIVDGVAKACR